MVYVATPTNCPPSCAERDDDNCEVPLLGICQCPAGLLIDGDKCAESCGGCHLDDGSYLQVGLNCVLCSCFKSFIAENLSQAPRLAVGQSIDKHRHCFLLEKLNYCR